MEQLNHVLREMGAAVAELRIRVSQAQRLGSRMAVREALKPLHLQLRWVVPMHRALVALRQQPQAWASPECAAKCVKSYVEHFAAVECSAQRYAYMSAEAQFGPMLDMLLLKPQPGVAPSQWEVVKVGEFAAAEARRLEQAAKARAEAGRACARSMEKFLDSLQPEQQEMLREAMRHSAASGRGRSLDLGPAHFAKLGL